MKCLLLNILLLSSISFAQDVPFFNRNLEKQQDIGAINQNFRELSDKKDLLSNSDLPPQYEKCLLSPAFCVNTYTNKVVISDLSLYLSSTTGVANGLCFSDGTCLYSAGVAGSGVYVDANTISGNGTLGSQLTLKVSSVTLQGNTFNNSNHLLKADADGYINKANLYPDGYAETYVNVTGDNMSNTLNIQGGSVTANIGMFYGTQISSFGATGCGTGGTVTTYLLDGSSYCVYSFLSGTDAFVKPSGVITGDVLIVGEGGPGGGNTSDSRGSGGSGSMPVYLSNYEFTSSSISVNVGDSGSVLANGENSTFGSVISTGGAKGVNTGNGTDGVLGSGGAGDGTARSGGVGTAFSGGVSIGGGTTEKAAGGGAGASQAGGAAHYEGITTVNFGGDGGYGLDYAIRTGVSSCYGGGAGGAASYTGGGHGSPGDSKGQCGGGNGSGPQGGGAENGSAGTANTGGGGGGARNGATGFQGGSGIVVVRHKLYTREFYDAVYSSGNIVADGDVEGRDLLASRNVVAVSSGNFAQIFGNAAKVTGAGGDISGVYDSIEVSSDSHQHSMQTLVGVRASTDTLSGDVTGTYTATVVGDDSHNHNLTTVNTSTINAILSALAVGVSTAAGLPNNNTFTGLNTFTSSVTVQSVGVKTGTYPTTITTGNQTDYLSWILPTSTGTIEQFLTSDGSGNLSWQAPSVPGEQSYYFSAQNSDITGYYNMYSTYPYTSAMVSTVTFTSSLASVNIGTWTTLSGYPSNPIIPEGTWGIHFHANKTSGTKDIRLYGKFYKRSSGGVLTLLGTSESSAILSAAITSYNIHFYSTGTILDTGDRIIAEAWGTITGSGTDPNISIYFGGLYFSAMTLPAPSVSIANFVPYNGATKLLNMNGYGVTTSSNVTAASFIGSGASLTGVITSTAQIVSIQNAHTAALSTAAYLASTQTFTGLNNFSNPVTMTSSLTVSGNAFSVGSSTFAIAQGITTIGGDTTITNSSATIAGIIATKVGGISYLDLTAGITAGTPGLYAAEFKARDNTTYTQILGSSATTTGARMYLAGSGFPSSSGLGNGDFVISMGTPTTSAIRFSGGAGAATAEIMRIDNNGVATISSTTISASSVTLLGAVTVVNDKLGINTSTPTQKISMNGSSNIGLSSVDGSDNQSLSILPFGGALSSSRGGFLTLRGNEATSAGITQLAAGNDSDGGYIQFDTQGLERMRIGYDGVATIGSSTTISGSSFTALNTLAVANGNAKILSNSTATNGTVALSLINSTSFDAIVGSVILSSRTNSPGAGEADLIFKTSKTSALEDITEKVRIKGGSGNVGIGNTAPSAKLDVTGNGSFSATLTSSGTAVFVSSAGFTSATSTVTFAGWVDIGYVIVNQSGAGSSQRAGCPSGYKALSGGCSGTSGAPPYYFCVTSETGSDTAAGTCVLTGSSGYSYSCLAASGGMTAFAVCARIK